MKIGKKSFWDFESTFTIRNEEIQETAKVMNDLFSLWSHFSLKKETRRCQLFSSSIKLMTIFLNVFLWSNSDAFIRTSIIPRRREWKSGEWNSAMNSERYTGVLVLTWTSKTDGWRLLSKWRRRGLIWKRWNADF